MLPGESQAKVCKGQLCTGVFLHAQQQQDTLCGAFFAWPSFQQAPPPRQQCPSNPSANPCSLPEQGLSTWVGLKSRRGEPVGAVQIKVSLNRLLGQCQLDHRYPPPPPARSSRSTQYSAVKRLTCCSHQVVAYLSSQSPNTSNCSLGAVCNNFKLPL